MGDYAPDRELLAGLLPIVVGEVPALPGPAVILTPYEGPEPDSRNGWEFPRLQVRVRASDALAAAAIHGEVFRVLQALSGMTLHSGAYLQDCYALQSAPIPIGNDDNGRWHSTVNYQIESHPGE